ncbi:MAG: glycosyltransferase family 4 protein [Armatimonadetes bacterium]|nr:glycosyltransferase family 4 protein [Armatimonadota bacterium]
MTPIYKPAFSGSAHLFRCVSEELVRRGHEVTVVTSNAGDYRAFWERDMPVNEMPSQESINGVTVKRLPVWRGHSCRNYWRLVHYSWKYRLPGSDWLRTWYDGPILSGIGGVAKRGEFDIVCAGLTPSMVVPYGRRLATKLGVPLALIPGLHADSAFNVDRANLRSIIRSADVLCANTEFEKGYLLDRFGVDANRVCVTGCGVDPSEFVEADGQAFRNKHGIPSDAPVVLFVGAEVQHKGLLVLLDAMTRVWRERQDTRLVVAGVRSSASEELDLRLSADPDLRSRLVRCNSFGDDEKSGIYDACDVFAMPSWSESFGIVYLEAWTRSKPVIGCKGSAVETVIADEVDGLLVEPRNEGQLAEALLTLLGSPDMRREFGNRGREKMLSTFTWDHVVDRYERAFGICGVR